MNSVDVRLSSYTLATVLLFVFCHFASSIGEIFFMKKCLISKRPEASDVDALEMEVVDTFADWDGSLEVEGNSSWVSRPGGDGVGLLEVEGVTSREP